MLCIWLLLPFYRNKTTSILLGCNRCSHCLWSTKTSCTCCQNNETWSKLLHLGILTRLECAVVSQRGLKFGARNPELRRRERVSDFVLPRVYKGEGG